MFFSDCGEFSSEYLGGFSDRISYTFIFIGAVTAVSRSILTMGLDFAQSLRLPGSTCSLYTCTINYPISNLARYYGAIAGVPEKVFRLATRQQCTMLTIQKADPN